MAYLRKGKHFKRLNNIDYFSHHFFGCSYYLSSVKEVATSSWTEIDGTWTVGITSGSSGSDNADLFGKFSSGRWTPTVSGYYQINAEVYIGGIDSNEVFYVVIRRNGGDDAHMIGFQNNRGANTTDMDLALSSGGIMALDNNDYASIFVYHNEGAAQNLQANRTRFSAHYVGTSDL
jgi:hypothetical protein